MWLKLIDVDIKITFHYWMFQIFLKKEIIQWKGSKIGIVKNKRVGPLKCKTTASCPHISLQCKLCCISLWFMCHLSVDHGEEVGKDNEHREDNSQPDSAVIGGLFYHLSLLHCFICNSQWSMKWAFTITHIVCVHLSFLLSLFQKWVMTLYW